MAIFHKVLKIAALPEGQGRCVALEGRKIAVFHVQEGFLAIDDTCTHAEASLAEGALMDDCTVECPWHGAHFDLNTGAAKSLPAVKAVRTYKTRVTGEDLEIEL